MKLTRDRLKQIIKEELKEMDLPVVQSLGSTPLPPGTEQAMLAADQEDRARIIYNLKKSFSDLIQQDQFLEFKEKNANLLKDPKVQKEIIDVLKEHIFDILNEPS